MCNLISENMKRIWKTRAFQIGAIIVAGLALFQILMNYRDYAVYGGTPYYDNALFSIAAVAVFPLAAFVSLYIGTEYSDGTLRNKIVIGHGRVEIYISNLCTMLIVGWLFLLIWSVAYLVPGIVLMESGNPPVIFIFIYAGIICELAVFSAIFTWISMVLGKKAASSIACMLLTLLFLLSGTVIQSTLDQEEYYAPAYRVTESGEIEYDGELEPNPNQPRRYFEEDPLQEISESIKEFGVIQPIVVTPRDGYYEIINGFEDNSFKPNKTVTKAELSEIL